MIDSTLLKQLNHPDPAQRKKAVMDLAKTKDRDALSYLAGVYRGDKDPEVREFARKAGIYINKHTGNGSAAKRKNDGVGVGLLDDDDDFVPKSKGTYYEEADLEETSPELNVSELDRERAMGLVKQALDIHMRGNNERATKYLQDALKKDPSLKRDSYTLGLATTITGLPSEEAIRQLTSTTYGDAADKKKKRTTRDPEEPSWGDAIVDLLIYMLVNTGLIALAIFVFVGVFLAGFTEALAASAASSSQLSTLPVPIDLNSIIGTLTGIGIPLIFLYSGVIGLISTVVLFIQLFFIHLVSTTILAGEGSMPRLISKTTVPLAFAYPIYYVAGAAIALYGVVNPDGAGTNFVLQIALSIGFSFWSPAAWVSLTASAPIRVGLPFSSVRLRCLPAHVSVR